MTPALLNRLIGICVLCMITLAAFSVQMVLWRSGVMPTQRIEEVLLPALYALLATAAAIGAWKQKPWAYVLVILVGAIQNIGTVQLHFSQRDNSGFMGVLSLSLTGLPLIVAMLAAMVLLAAHYSRAARPVVARDSGPST